MPRAVGEKLGPTRSWISSRPCVWSTGDALVLGGLCHTAPPVLSHARLAAALAMSSATCTGWAISEAWLAQAARVWTGRHFIEILRHPFPILPEHHDPSSCDEGCLVASSARNRSEALFNTSLFSESVDLRSLPLAEALLRGILLAVGRLADK